MSYESIDLAARVADQEALEDLTCLIKRALALTHENAQQLAITLIKHLRLIGWFGLGDHAEIMLEVGHDMQDLTRWRCIQILRQRGLPVEAKMIADLPFTLTEGESIAYRRDRGPAPNAQSR
jgi:hypothetical protein